MKLSLLTSLLQAHPDKQFRLVLPSRDAVTKGEVILSLTAEYTGCGCGPSCCG